MRASGVVVALAFVLAAVTGGLIGRAEPSLAEIAAVGLAAIAILVVVAFVVDAATRGDRRRVRH